MTTAIYLTGSTIDPLQLASQKPEPDWRTLATVKLQRYGFRVLNPLELTWSGLDQQEIFQRRVRRALDLINQCDAVLANLIKASYGAAMEIFYAYQRGKMVTVVGQSPFSPWVLSHSQARFEDIEDAVEYLIGEHPEMDAINWAIQYESLLSEHYEQFPLEGEPDYQFFGGELPVLVIAPHATAFFREGEFQEPDAFTGSLAAVLNRQVRCHALISSYCLAADPCWHLETPMVRAVADIVKAGQVGAVLVLLGSPWHESPGLHVVAFGSDEATGEDLAGRLRFKLSALEPVAADVLDGSSWPLIRFIGEELKVPGLAVKMHKRYRMPRLQPELFALCIDLIGKFVSEVGFELLRSRS